MFAQASAIESCRNSMIPTSQIDILLRELNGCIAGKDMFGGLVRLGLTGAHLEGDLVQKVRLRCISVQDYDMPQSRKISGRWCGGI